MEINIGLTVKYPLFLSIFDETWIFSKKFSKKSEISDFHDNRLQWGSRIVTCGRTDGQTWWSNSAKAPDISNSLNTRSPCVLCRVLLCSKLVRRAN